MGGRATMYDAYRLADDHSLGRLPSLVREATGLVWRAAPRELATAVGVQVVSAAGVVVQLLVGRAVLESVLAADRLHRDVWSVVPGLAVLLVVTTVLSFGAVVRNQLQALLVELTARHAQGRVLDVAAAVDLEAFENPDFHDRLQREQAGAMSRPWMMTSNLLSLLGAVIGSVGLLVALAALHPVLLPLAVVAYVPTWLAATRNSRSVYRFGYTMTPDDRRRWALSYVLSGRPHAAEVRAFQLAGFLRRQYDHLYERRVGKTTLAKLMCNLYSPTSGRITWDGVDLATCAPAELGRHVAVIFQDFVQYFMSAADNIAVGDHSQAHDLARVEAAAVKSGADDFLAALADGYDTMLGRQSRGATSCRSGSGSASRWPAPSSAPRRCSSSTNPRPPSTRGPSTPCSAACGPCPPAAPCC